MPATIAPPAKVEPLLIDVHEVAALANVSTATVSRWSRQGLMPKGRKIVNLVRWSKAEIEKWVEDGCPKSARATS